ncbi:cell adhesion molecule 4-like isoform X1 [Dermacentor andersoni]|uniref:cell adhesion molecule 4-like isoform X1 n=1 Tax=Dermacentor andersoni TaxID=34620 RepID=UPI002417B027|nr:cell adhesion molecule 2-like isoform X3 [Dermacentor andersoni]
MTRLLSWLSALRTLHPIRLRTRACTSVDPLLLLQVPPQVTRITNRGQLFEGESVELECITSGSRPPAEITWQLDGELLSDAYLFVSPDENSTTSAVSFTPRREHDGKLLTCEAANPLLENSSLLDEWRLVVYYKPEVYLRVISSCGGSQVGSFAVHLRCEAKANPRVSRFTWKLNGRTVDYQRPVREGDPSRRLSRTSLKTNLTGSFLCTAENSEGLTDSDALLLPQWSCCIAGWCQWMTLNQNQEERSQASHWKHWPWVYLCLLSLINTAA